MKKVITKTRERVIYRFTCANRGCQVNGTFDPERAVRDKTKNNWLLLSRVIEMTLVTDPVKMREFMCLKCGAKFFKFHEDTPENLIKRFADLKLRKETIPEMISVEVEVDKDGKEIVKKVQEPKQPAAEETSQPKEEENGTDNKTTKSTGKKSRGKGKGK